MLKAVRIAIIASRLPHLIRHYTMHIGFQHGWLDASILLIIITKWNAIDLIRRKRIFLRRMSSTIVIALIIVWFLFLILLLNIRFSVKDVKEKESHQKIRNPWHSKHSWRWKFQGDWWNHTVHWVFSSLEDKSYNNSFFFFLKPLVLLDCCTFADKKPCSYRKFQVLSVTFRVKRCRSLLSKDGCCPYCWSCSAGAGWIMFVSW